MLSTSSYQTYAHFADALCDRDLSLGCLDTQSGSYRIGVDWSEEVPRHQLLIGYLYAAYNSESGTVCTVLDLRFAAMLCALF